MKDERRKNSYICSKINVYMKKLLPFLGLFLIIIGTILLIATRFSTLSSHNSLLVAGLLCILSGIILHIRRIKHESKFPY